MIPWVVITGHISQLISTQKSSFSGPEDETTAYHENKARLWETDVMQHNLTEYKVTHTKKTMDDIEILFFWLLAWGCLSQWAGKFSLSKG